MIRGVTYWIVFFVVGDWVVQLNLRMLFKHRYEMVHVLQASATASECTENSKKSHDHYMYNAYSNHPNRLQSLVGKGSSRGKLKAHKSASSGSTLFFKRDTQMSISRFPQLISYTPSRFFSAHKKNQEGLVNPQWRALVYECLLFKRLTFYNQSQPRGSHPSAQSGTPMYMYMYTTAIHCWRSKIIDHYRRPSSLWPFPESTIVPVHWNRVEGSKRTSNIVTSSSGAIEATKKKV